MSLTAVASAIVSSTSRRDDFFEPLASVLGALVGSTIGLVLTGDVGACAISALEGCFASGCLCLFFVVATAFIDSDRLS